MAYFRCLSNRSNLLTRRRQPSIGYIVHHGDDCKHNLTDEVPSSLGFRSFLQQRGFGSGFARATLLGSMKDERCANFSVRASFCRRMSTANGVESEKDESIDDGDEVVSDTTVETAASVANEVAIAAADSFFPIALVQHGIDAIHIYFGFNWWACIVCATIIMRLSVLPLVVMQMKASSKLMLMGPHLGAIKEKILDGLVAPRSGTIKQKILDGAVDIYDGYKQVKMVFKEYGVSPLTAVMVLPILGPLFACFFLAVTNMAEKVPSFRNGGAYWFVDLSSPDPSYIFPILTALTFWLFVECVMQEGMEGDPSAPIMRITCKGLAISIVTFTVPEAVSCYWITNNLFSLGYVQALKVPAVKRFLGLPEMPVTPPAPAPGSSQNPSRALLAVKENRPNAIMIRSIESLEKPMKG